MRALAFAQTLAMLMGFIDEEFDPLGALMAAQKVAASPFWI